MLKLVHIDRNWTFSNCWLLLFAFDSDSLFQLPLSVITKRLWRPLCSVSTAKSPCLDGLQLVISVWFTSKMFKKRIWPFLNDAVSQSSELKVNAIVQHLKATSRDKDFFTVTRRQKGLNRSWVSRHTNLFIVIGELCVYFMCLFQGDQICRNETTLA